MTHSASSPIPAQADVLLVTATLVESRAVLKRFQQETGQPLQTRTVGPKTYYYLGTVAGAVVFLVQSEMGSGGLGAALMTVQRGIDALKPTSIMMVGIAFGVDETKQQIGDVLVSHQIFLYDPQRLGTRDGELEIRLRGDRATASPMLLDRFRATELAWSIRRDLEPLPQVFFGPICTGEKLLDNLAERARIRSWLPEAIGGEMEGAGLYVAATDNNVNWILVKAICDWADGNKSVEKDQRQQLAAENATAFVLDTIKQGGLVLPRDTQPGGSGTGGVNIVNQASNQGAQGVFHGPVTINNDNRRRS